MALDAVSQIDLRPFYHQFQGEAYRTSYLEIGSGHIPIFLFPGILSPIKNSFIPLLTLMASDSGFFGNYTFFGWDDPGYFGSNPPRRNLSDISFDKEVEMAHALIRNLRNEKFVMVGYSGGSQSALKFSIEYPELVEKLILIGGWDRFEVEEIQQNPWYKKISKSGGLIDVMLEAEFGGDREQMLEHWETWHNAVMKQYSNLDKRAWQKRYANFKIPTLIVWGSRDSIVSRKNTNDLHAAIKNSRLEIIDEAAHSVHLTFPEQFFEVMKKFLEE